MSSADHEIVAREPVTIDVLLRGRPELADELVSYLGHCALDAVRLHDGAVTIRLPAADPELAARRLELRFVLGVFQLRHTGAVIETRDGSLASLAA